MIFFFLIAICAISDSVIYDYGIIFDAGSSHTEVYVYKWDQRVTKFNETTQKLVFPETKPMAMQQHQKTDAVTSCVGNLTQISGLLQPLIDFAENLIKDDQDRWHQFPVYFKATAGVRALEREKREALMQAVRDFFASDSVKFLYQPENIVILSGEEEGYFGWLSVNYWYERLHKVKTYGACDMGGASLQITWEVEPSFDVLEGLTILRLWGVTHRVFTHSFQGYGQNLALESVSRMVGQGGYHPCFLHADQNFTVTVDGTDYSYIGSGQETECVETIKAFLDHDHYCENSIFAEECTTTGIYFPKNQLKDVNFYFFSSFGFLQSDLVNIGFKQHTTLNELMDLRTKIFNWNYTEFLDALNSGIPEQFLRNVPFTLAYSIAILQEFGFDDDVPQTWQEETTEGKELNWATGSMISDADILDAIFVQPTTPKPDTGLTSEGKKWQITAIFAIAWSVLLIIIICICQNKRKSYEELREPLVQQTDGV